MRRARRRPPRRRLRTGAPRGRGRRGDPCARGASRVNRAAPTASAPSAGLLTSEDGVRRVQAALRELDLDGWLLYEFHGVNRIAVALLGLGKTTRRSFVLIPSEGEPVALIHAIEASSWRHWPFA